MGCGGSKSEQATSPKPKAKAAEKSSPAKTDNAAPAASSDPAEMSAPAASSAPAGSFSAGKNIKLISFKGPGLGDLARRMLVLKNVEFEDVRIEKEDWPEHKPSKFSLLYFSLGNPRMRKAAIRQMCISPIITN